MWWDGSSGTSQSHEQLCTPPFLKHTWWAQREMTKEGPTTETAAVMERMEDVRRESFKVLQEMAD